MKRLQLAVQKSGRLKDGSIKLLKECGIDIDNSKDQLKAASPNFPLDILFLRNSDIPKYVASGVVDCAILGGNTLVEQPGKAESVLKLGFSKCRVSLAVPKDAEVGGIDYFNGKRIATSYPVTLNSFLESKGITAEIHAIGGSVEIAPNIGIADAICDIVSSGSTLFKNGLKESFVILKSEAELVRNMKLGDEQSAILERLCFRIKSVLAAKKNQYVLLNAPNDKLETICALLPGVKSPTVMPLKEEGWSSVHSVINEDDFWDRIESLRDAGAEGILIVPIQKMIA